MKSGAKILFFAAIAGGIPWLAGKVQAQSLPVGLGIKPSWVSYFDPPHEQMIETRLSGTEMAPLPGALLYDVKKLKIERFNVGGKLEAVVEAPECVYAPLDGTASSTGHLDITLKDGKMQLKGEGFLWQQNESRLTISNQVSTVINMGNWKLTSP